MSRLQCVAQRWPAHSMRLHNANSIHDTAVGVSASRGAARSRNRPVWPNYNCEMISKSSLALAALAWKLPFSRSLIYNLLLLNYISLHRTDKLPDCVFGLPVPMSVPNAITVHWWCWPFVLKCAHHQAADDGVFCSMHCFRRLALPLPLTLCRRAFHLDRLVQCVALLSILLSIASISQFIIFVFEFYLI